MLLTKQQLLAAVMASDDEARYALTHVKIDPGAAGGTVTATNGHMAIQVVSRELPREGDIPEAPRQHGGEPESAIYLHAGPALDAAKVLPRKPKLPGFQLGRLLVESGGRVSIGSSDGLIHQIVMADQPEGIVYPGVEALLRAQAAKAPVARILLSAKYLKKIAQYAEKFAAFGSPAVKLTFYGHAEPVQIEWEDPRHVVKGLLMPMKIHDEAPQVGPEPGTIAPPAVLTPTDETMPGAVRLEPSEIMGVDDALAAAALNAREVVEKTKKRRGRGPAGAAAAE